MYTVVEISFDKVVGHWFSDPMSLVTHEVHHGWHQADTVWKFHLSRSLEILSSFTASNWWLWIWVHGKMCMQKHCTVSVAFTVFFFTTRIKMFMSAMQLKACLKQLNRAHTWSYHHAINLDTLDFSWCFAKGKPRN